MGPLHELRITFPTKASKLRSIFLPQAIATILGSIFDHTTKTKKHKKLNYTNYVMPATIQENGDVECPQPDNDPNANPADGDVKHPCSANDDTEDYRETLDKAIKSTWKLVALGKHRSESFFHERDPHFRTVNNTQAILGDFYNTLYTADHVEGQVSRVIDEIIHLLPKIIAVQEEMREDAEILRWKHSKPRKATDEVAKDILSQLDKVDTEVEVRNMALLRLYNAANLNEESFKIGGRLGALMLDLSRLGIRLKIAIIKTQDDEFGTPAVDTESLKEQESHANVSDHDGVESAAAGLDALIRELRAKPNTPAKEGQAPEYTHLPDLMDKLGLLAVATEGHAADAEFIEQLAKFMLESPPFTPPQLQDSPPKKQLRLAWAMLHLWKFDRERCCKRLAREEVEDIPFGGPGRAERYRELFKGYRHEGYRLPDTAEAAGGDSAVEICDREPGSYLLSLDEGVRGVILMCEDEDTKRSLAPRSNE